MKEKRQIGYITPSGYMKTSSGWRKAPKIKGLVVKKQQDKPVVVDKKKSYYKPQYDKVKLRALLQERDRMGVSPGYVCYTGAGDESLRAVVSFAITFLTKRGVDRKRAKEIETISNRLRNADKPELLDMMAKLGGQKLFERYVRASGYTPTEQEVEENKAHTEKLKRIAASND